MYKPTVHVNGVGLNPPDLTEQLPWVYAVIAVRHKVIYIGETFDQSGLIGRLSSHFGPYSQSSLRRCASRHAGVRRLAAPFLVFAARLPYLEEDAPFQGGSLLIRRRLEATLHECVASRFVSQQPGWVLVSSSSPTEAPTSEAIEAASNSIFDCLRNGLGFLSDLSAASPWNLVLLDYRTLKAGEDLLDVGKTLEEIEMQLFEWLTVTLKAELGEKKWWTEGVPETIRVECVTRREREGEGESLPAEAYLMLIDFKDIVRKNWDVCRTLVEEIAGVQGKDRATKWIVDLNEMRKLWAHPVKQRYRPVDGTRIAEVKQLRDRIDRAFRKHR